MFFSTLNDSLERRDFSLLCMIYAYPGPPMQSFIGKSDDLPNSEIIITFRNVSRANLLREKYEENKENKTLWWKKCIH